jgi:hypothetical protein
VVQTTCSSHSFNSRSILSYMTFLAMKSSIFSMALSAHSGPWILIQFRNLFTQTVGLLGRGISPLQYRTTQTQNKRIHTTNVHALSGIRTHATSVRASEDSSYLRPRGYSDRLLFQLGIQIRYQPTVP